MGCPSDFLENELVSITMPPVPSCNTKASSGIAVDCSPIPPSLSVSFGIPVFLLDFNIV